MFCLNIDIKQRVKTICGHTFCLPPLIDCVLWQNQCTLGVADARIELLQCTTGACTGFQAGGGVQKIGPPRKCNGPTMVLFSIPPPHFFCLQMKVNITYPLPNCSNTNIKNIAQKITEIFFSIIFNNFRYEPTFRSKI